MAGTRQQLREDRLLRDAALAVVKGDIARIRSDLEGRNIGERALHRLGDGASELLDQASEKAADNKGVVALLAGAIVLWFARFPILELFGFDTDYEDDTPTPNGEEL